MEEIEINLVGNDEEIQTKEIFNDFNFNYIPINNLPISYFPTNNNILSNELKKKRETIISSYNFGTELVSNGINSTLTINNNSYKIMIKKTIDCDIKMNNIDDNPDKIRLTKGIYEILYHKNNYNIISKIIDNELRGHQILIWEKQYWYLSCIRMIFFCFCLFAPRRIYYFINFFG